MLMAPVNYSDMLQGILISRGVDPRRGQMKPATKVVLPSVKVIGGASTPEIVQAGQAWGLANAAKNWQKETGSTQESISFWTNPEK